MIKKSLPVLMACLLMAGCATDLHITNLTPQKEFRNQDGFYSVEAAIASRQQTLRWKSIRPIVVVGKDFYTMRPTPLMTNRWETLIPVTPGQNLVFYRFKFDFDYNSFASPGRTDSKLSPVFRMEILEK